MIPPVPIKRTRFVGNTAIAGAKMALTSRDIQREARILAKQIRYLELAVDPDFREEYISALYLPHKYLRGFSIELYNRCLLKKYWVLFS